VGLCRLSVSPALSLLCKFHVHDLILMTIPFLMSLLVFILRFSLLSSLFRIFTPSPPVCTMALMSMTVPWTIFLIPFQLATGVLLIINCFLCVPGSGLRFVLHPTLAAPFTQLFPVVPAIPNPRHEVGSHFIHRVNFLWCGFSGGFFIFSVFCNSAFFWGFFFFFFFFFKEKFRFLCQLTIELVLACEDFEEFSDEYSKVVEFLVLIL